MVGHDGSVHQNLDDLCSTPVEVPDLAQLITTDVQVEDTNRALPVAELPQVGNAVVHNKLSVDVLLTHHVATHLGSHGGSSSHVHGHGAIAHHGGHLTACTHAG